MLRTVGFLTLCEVEVYLHKGKRSRYHLPKLYVGIQVSIFLNFEMHPNGDGLRMDDEETVIEVKDAIAVKERNPQDRQIM